MSWLGDRARAAADRLRKTGKRIREALPGQRREAPEQPRGGPEPAGQQQDGPSLEVRASDEGLLERVRGEYFTPDGELRKPHIKITGEFGVYISDIYALKPWAGSIDSEKAAANRTAQGSPTSKPISPKNAERLAAAAGTGDPEAITQAIDQYLTEDYIAHGFENVGGYGPGVGMRVVDYASLEITWSGEPWTPEPPPQPTPAAKTPRPSIVQRVRSALRRPRRRGR